MKKVEKDIMWFLYYNGERTINDLQNMKNGKPRAKKIVILNIDSLEKQGYIVKCPYMRFEQGKGMGMKLFKLTSKGFRVADKLPRVVVEFNRKAQEYEDNHRENEHLYN